MKEENEKNIIIKKTLNIDMKKSLPINTAQPKVKASNDSGKQSSSKNNSGNKQDK